jgi:hypothetical protein
VSIKEGKLSLESTLMDDLVVPFLVVATRIGQRSRSTEGTDYIDKRRRREHWRSTEEDVLSQGSVLEPRLLIGERDASVPWERKIWALGRLKVHLD